MGKVQELKAEIKNFKVQDKEALENFRLRFISRKSIIGELFAEMQNVAPEERKVLGQQINELKNSAEEKFRSLAVELGNYIAESEDEHLDVTLPPVTDSLGSIHPLTIVRARFIEIFEKIGFTVADGPEIEDDWHNFTALNFPENHPAREMQDTFFIKKDPDIALRTHTSNVQVRVMQSQKPPIRILAPGRVFRNEAISARAHCVFHQVEGLYIDNNVSFKDLKHVLYYFAREMFTKDTEVRLRPSFFPFTEPSAELDITCLVCHGKGCNICKYTGWVEIGGSGMVDPNVLSNCGIDPEEYTGYAFGLGIERIALLKYEIKDLRLFTENDVRFLQQFKAQGF
jgi:phenylalanyl-tRNA synthetase alpha chain